MIFGFCLLVYLIFDMPLGLCEENRFEKTHLYGNTICQLGTPLGRSSELEKGIGVEFEEPVMKHLKNETKKPLAMCVLNQRTGTVIFYHEFPLYKLWAVWMDLKRHLENIAPERIVVLQLEGESVNGLRNVTRLLTSLGSLLVEHLETDSVWTWAFVYGGKTLYEKFVSNINVKRYQLSSSHSWFPLSEVEVPFDKEPNNGRWTYCSKYGVMGNLCDESVRFTDLFSRAADENTDPFLESVPVIITAGSRTSYLYQSLKSYLNANKSIKKNFHVLLGTNSSASVELLALLRLPYTYLPPALYNDTEFFPFKYYREVYLFVSKNYESRYVIFLEEDIEIAPDFFLYIKKTIHLLDKDPTLYCIAGYSATGLNYLAYDESVLLRADVQVGWGYAVKMDFVLEALKFWPTEDMSRLSVYDGYLYKKVKGKRECILPEVSRTRHFGIGMNTHFLSSEKVFFTMPISKSQNASFQNMDMLELSRWNSYLRTQISSSIPISENVCAKNFLAKLAPGSYVIFYNFTTQTENSTYINFFTLGNCFKTWVYSFQGQHDFIDILKIAPSTVIYLIAYPESSVSDLKPTNYVPFDLKNISKKDYAIYAWQNVAVQQLSYMEYEEPTSENIWKLFL